MTRESANHRKPEGKPPYRGDWDCVGPHPRGRRWTCTRCHKTSTELFRYSCSSGHLLCAVCFGRRFPAPAIPGEKRTRRGYVWIRHGDRWRPEHRVVMERRLRRRLRPDEHVHHRNGDKADNRPENLEVLRADTHALVTAALRRRDRQRRGSGIGDFPTAEEGGWDR